MTDAAVEEVLRAQVLDEPDRGLTVDHYSADVSAWRLAAEDWGLTMLPVRGTAQEAQADAEACRSALVEAGWPDQRDAGVQAHQLPDGSGWRGGLNLVFGLLPPVEALATTPYVPAED